MTTVKKANTSKGKLVIDPQTGGGKSVQVLFCYSSKQRLLEASLALANVTRPVEETDKKQRTKLKSELYGWFEIYRRFFGLREWTFRGHDSRALLRTKKLTDVDLEKIRQSLRDYLDAIHGRRNVATTPTMEVRVLYVRTASGFEAVYSSKEIWAVLFMSALRVIEDRGHDAVRKCEQCARFFLGSPIKKFCSRPCLEINKLQRYKQSPQATADYNEDHALIMWRKTWRKSHLGQEPRQVTKEKWLARYRGRRRRKSLVVSKRPPKEVI